MIIRRTVGDHFFVTFDSTKVSKEEVACLSQTWGFLVPPNSIFNGQEWSKAIINYSSNPKAIEAANKVVL